MKLFTIRTAALVPVLALSACSFWNQTVSDIKQANAPVVITDSLAQICQNARDNQVRAKDMYEKKQLTVDGRIRGISEEERVFARYDVLIQAAKVNVHAGTSHFDHVKSLNVGRSVKATGIVTGVTNDAKGCSISLKDTTF